jgi:hypothetical protein
MPSLSFSGVTNTIGVAGWVGAGMFWKNSAAVDVKIQPLATTKAVSIECLKSVFMMVANFMTNRAILAMESNRWIVVGFSG